jgi:hypothetical protein
MTEPLTEFSRSSTNGTLKRASDSVEHVDAPHSEAEAETGYIEESPPSTPRWVKLLGILLVVLVLAFAGLHLTGHVPVHMAGADGASNAVQLP